jgi:hypothetical protein
MVNTSVSSGPFTIDTREVRAEARKWGTLAEKWLMDELTTSFDRAGHIAQHEANVLIKGGEGSNLAKASKVKTTVTGIDITTEVSWDDAVSEDGFHYAAAVDKGRKEIFPVTAKALRFEIGGAVIFATHAKEAPAQDFTGRGRDAAEPKMLREINAGGDRWAARMEAA